VGLFSKIVPILEGVAGVALMATGVGVVAGAMLLTSALASSGVIGGSVGKFLNSGWGQGLMAAVSLGSTAYAMYGADSLQTSLTAMNATTAADVTQSTAGVAAQNAAQIEAGVNQSLAATTQDLANVPVGGALSEAAGVSTAGFATDASAGANGLTAQALNSTPQVSATGAPMASAQQLQSTEQAVAPGTSSGGTLPGGPGHPMVAAGQTDAGMTSAPPAAAAPQQGEPLPDTSSSTLGEGTAPSSAVNGASGENVTGNSGGGMLDATKKWLNAPTTNGAYALQAGGSLVGGLGQGIVQKQSMQDQINAAQWAGRTYMDPKEQAMIQGAASAPITVPQGYLQRAQALKGMLGSTVGIQPGAQPGSTPAPSGGPVPVWQMNSTPRGGVI